VRSETATLIWYVPISIPTDMFLLIMVTIFIQENEICPKYNILNAYF